MTVDLGAIFDLAQPIVESLIRSSGTQVRVQRRPHGRGSSTIDPVTLERTETPATVIAAETPAILAPYDSGFTIEGTTTPVRIGDVVVLLLPEIVDVRGQDELVVLTCRDPRLVERVIDVETLLDSSAGVVRLLHGRPRSQDPT